MQFTYRASDCNGQQVCGREEADSKEQLIHKLKNQGKFLLDIKEESSFSLQWTAAHVSKQELLNFTQQLAGLLSAGIPLEKALGILSKLTYRPVMSNLITQIRRWLQEGLSFTAALEQLNNYFPALYINLVRAGETGGILPQVLTRLAKYIEEEINLKRFIISSLIYPCIIVTASIAAILFYVGAVIPNFKSIFETSGSELPLVTKIVMLVGNGIQNYWWVFLLVVFAIIIWGFIIINTPGGRLRLDQLKIKLPLIGEIIKKIATARLTLALSLLNGSGVPILNCIQVAGQIVGNEVMKQALNEVEQEVKRGNTLAASMAQQGVFPVLAVEMIGVGEESGNLSAMLEQVAHNFETETKHAVSIFLTVFEPFLILCMVGIIAFLAIAILLPIIQMNSQLNPMS